MTISNNPHLPDREGDIPEQLPKETREISAFFSLLIEETMETMPSELTPTWIRCFGKGCDGVISTKLDFDNNELHWKCSKCRKQGTITGL